MTGRSELRIKLAANAQEAQPVRHALGAFLSAIGIEGVRREDILTAAGEALVNAIEHAYDGRPADTDEIEIFARQEDGTGLVIDVSDRGRFIELAERPGRGLGLRIARAIAQTVSIDTENGTTVRMIFTT
ncbi:MAG: ATP-binding protein [Candidatus Baltobacteraceae bacterium]